MCPGQPKLECLVQTSPFPHRFLGTYSSMPTVACAAHVSGFQTGQPNVGNSVQLSVSVGGSCEVGAKGGRNWNWGKWSFTRSDSHYDNSMMAIQIESIAEELVYESPESTSLGTT